MHVRRAVEGDSKSVEWVVEHFTPALLTQISYRLPKALHLGHDPEDILNDVWIRTLPRLADLVERAGRYTPVLMSFLSTTVLNHINNLAAKQARRNRATADTPAAGSPRELPQETIGIVTRASRRDAYYYVMKAIDGLSERDRAVLVLRGVEQLSNEAVAERLDVTPTNAATIYNRALARLRELLPDSVFAELAND